MRIRNLIEKINQLGRWPARTVANASIQNLTGMRLGQYELRELLGAGGMGAVYCAYQPNLDRLVAVKVLSSDLANQPGHMERFIHEARIYAALDHPHIIKVFDYGVQGNISYLVLHLLNGGTLAERMAQRAQTENSLPSLGEVSTLLKQIGSALDYAHSEGVIHRDIKPSNVMFDNHGNAYLVDFGIAKLAESTKELTATGVVIGTWGYMAPEQWLDETLTSATDQYALGIMTYLLVTGHMPFEAQNPVGMMHKHMKEVPPSPETYSPELPEALADVIQRTLAKQPGDRFPTCIAFAQAFDRVIQGRTGRKTQFFTAPVERKTPEGIHTLAIGEQVSDTVTVSRSIYRHLAMWLALVVILMLMGVSTFMALGGSGKPTPTDTVRATITATATTSQIIVLLPSNTPRPTNTFVPSATATVVPEVRATPIVSPTIDVVQAAQETLDANQTLMAAQWTPPPTEDVQSTINAQVTALYAQQLTETATVWTDTPPPTSIPTVTATLTTTPTSTPTPTATLTSTPRPTDTQSPTPTFFPTVTVMPEIVAPSAIFIPTETPSVSAQIFVGSNDDWMPVEQEFNGVPMVLVPAGCFMMGHDYDLAASGLGLGTQDGPMHKICFDTPLWIDKLEVTNAQFAALSGQAAQISSQSDPDHPRETITWLEAQAFCEQRGARLPTEAEWEYAARGPDAWLYPWGNDFNPQATIWADNSGGGTQVGGMLAEGASWTGALDMSGNVWEWVVDWYAPDYYATLPDGVVNPVGPASGTERGIRGGSWGNGDPIFLSAVRRNKFDPAQSHNKVGFRCVAPAK